MASTRSGQINTLDEKLDTHHGPLFLSLSKTGRRSISLFSISDRTLALQKCFAHRGV